MWRDELNRALGLCAREQSSEQAQRQGSPAEAAEAELRERGEMGSPAGGGVKKPQKQGDRSGEAHREGAPQTQGENDY